MGKALRIASPERDLILRSARALEDFARGIRDANRCGKKLWFGKCDEDRAYHDELRRLARGLRRQVKTL